MKRIITLTALVLAGWAGSPASEAQTITNVSFNDSCAKSGWGSGNSTNMFMSVTGGSSSCIVETNYGDGTKKDTAGLASSGTNFFAWGTHYYGTAGTYTIKTVLVCGGIRVDSVSRSYNAACTFIGGFLYKDVNTNCIYNNTEPLVYGNAQIEVDSAGVLIDTISASGYWGYGIRATTTTVYKFKLLASLPGFTTSCPSSGIITYTFNPSITAIPYQNFGFNCSSTPVYDYKLSWVRAFRAAASGGSSYIYLNAYNTTCQTGTGTVTLTVSPKYTIGTAGILPTPSSVSGNTITWTFTGMTNGTSSHMYVPLTPKSTTSLGDTTCNYAVISPTADANAANNIINLCDSVSNSWDPNEKTVFPAGAVAAGTKLTYTIDFENLGNDTAFNIHIQDTLSQHLNANSFVMIGSTHHVIPTIYQAGGKNILKFDFPNIKLESKAVPMRNKGQVVFTMNLKTALAPGTSVPNRAGIFFDGNPVVLTNYAVSTIPVPKSVPGIAGREDMKVFPNPAGNVLNIQVATAGWNEAVLSNALGQVVLRQPLNIGGNVLNIAPIPTGIYHLQVKGSAGAVSEKIEKQ